MCGFGGSGACCFGGWVGFPEGCWFCVFHGSCLFMLWVCMLRVLWWLLHFVVVWLFCECVGWFWWLMWGFVLRWGELVVVWVYLCLIVIVVFLTFSLRRVCEFNLAVVYGCLL